MLHKKSFCFVLLLATALSGCSSLRDPHPMKAGKAAEIDAVAREMQHAALQQAERSPTPTGR